MEVSGNMNCAAWQHRTRFAWREGERKPSEEAEAGGETGSSRKVHSEAAMACMCKEKAQRQVREQETLIQSQAACMRCVRGRRAGRRQAGRQPLCAGGTRGCHPLKRGSRKEEEKYLPSFLLPSQPVPVPLSPPASLSPAQSPKNGEEERREAAAVRVRGEARAQRCLSLLRDRLAGGGEKV